MYHWTKEEIEDLKLGYEIGLPVKEIAEILNINYKSVIWKAGKLGLIHPNSRSIRKLTDDIYDSLLLENCPSIIRIGKFIDTATRIKHKCLICNKIHLVRPNDKLRGWGHCGSRGRGVPVNKPGIVYVVYIHIYDLYKIGVTSKTTKQRFSSNNLSIDNYTIILERHFNTGTECNELEKEWLSNIKDYKVNTGLLKTGNTETFRY